MSRRLPCGAVGGGYDAVNARIVITLALVALALVAINGRTPLEIIAWALIILIVGGAILVVAKLVGLVTPGSGPP
jgi:hypothetical protein